MSDTNWETDEQIIYICVCQYITRKYKVESPNKTTTQEHIMVQLGTFLDFGI